MIVTIMQPTYLPWIGYFDLMDNADVFVLFDTVQFEKQAWQQRNRVKTSENTSKWLSVPVVQDLGQRIRDVNIDASNPWRRKHWGSIEQYYKRAPYWKPYSEGLAEIYAQPWDSLYKLNFTLINYLKDQIGITTQLVQASDIPVSGEKVGLLVNICHHFKADVYLSPVRAAEYIEKDNIFAAEGITLQYHQYTHPVYPQLFGEFLSHMSVIDLLFNQGPRSLEIIRSGRLMRDEPSIPQGVL
jgi:hypothetical protein